MTLLLLLAGAPTVGDVAPSGTGGVPVIKAQRLKSIKPQPVTTDNTQDTSSTNAQEITSATAQRIKRG